MFGIQQAALVIESAPDVATGRRFGARIDLQFGQATETVQGSAANEPRPDVYRHIWQAYGTYVFDVGRGLTMDFGKFASSLGFETNYAKDNNNFSRAYLFNFLPFYHSGLRLSLPVSDKVTVMYMLTNGVQQTEDFNNFKSNHVAAILKPTSAVTWTVNYYFGQEQPDGGAARWSKRLLQSLRHVRDRTPDAEGQPGRGRELRHESDQQGRSHTVSSGSRSLPAISAHDARGVCRFATSGLTTRDCSAVSIRCCRSSRSLLSTSRQTDSRCVANSGATGRTESFFTSADAWRAAPPARTPHSWA